MKKFFSKLKKDCRGAVTVFVTLLLIPAIIISGSAVDLSRMYVANSIIHDANQLGANSALASYDALLQDLYGLYGMMMDDEQLASMMEEYIEVAVFGEGERTKTMGSLYHFYGDKDSLNVSCDIPDDKNLRDPETLRRQIEEYAKFRAPAIIVSGILDKLDTFDKIKEDGAVIKDKMEIDDKVDEIDKVYKKLYNCIEKVNEGKSVETNGVQSINQFIDRIDTELGAIYYTRDDYTSAFDSEDDDAMEDWRKKYEGQYDNLNSFAKGGTVKTGFMRGNDGPFGYEPGGFNGSYETEGLKGSLNNTIDKLEKIKTNNNWEDDSIKDMVSLAESADKKKNELKQMLDDLENRLNSGKCSNELKNGLAVDRDANGKTYIDNYRDLLGYDVKSMAYAVKNHNEPQIDGMVSMLENDVFYGNSNLGFQGMFSVDALNSINENQSGYEIDLIIQNRERSSKNQALLEDKLAYIEGIAPQKYTVPGTFEVFQSNVFNSTHNKDFYDLLKERYANSANEGKKKSILEGIGKATKAVSNQFKKFLEFDPLGAYEYKAGSTPTQEENDDKAFGEKDNWNDTDNVKSDTKNALNDNLLSRLSGAANSAANKIILLTYDSEMFSCYATNDGYSGGDGNSEHTEENMAGIPMGIKVNYFFQSELEYLYHGNLNNAKSNLKAVTAMIFLIRFVLDYVASFMVNEVKNTVNTVKSALSFLGPIGQGIGELVRLLMALGEGVTDVGRLKDGTAVALFKNNDTWRFSLGGILDQIADGVVGELSDEAFGTGGDNDDDPNGFVYKDYMRLFLLLVDGNVLAERTANLIELNVTNYKEGIGNNGDRTSRQNAMTSATLFEMEKANTDFRVTTSVNMNMMFLSSPVAQKGTFGGVVPPKSKEIKVKDYRGY